MQEGSGDLLGSAGHREGSLQRVQPARIETGLSLLACLLILVVKNVRKCSTLIMGCTYFALTTFGYH